MGPSIRHAAVLAALVGAGCPANPEVSLGRPDRGPPPTLLPDPEPQRDAGVVRPDGGQGDGGETFFDLSLAGMSDPPQQLRPGQSWSVDFIVRGRGQASTPPSNIKVWLVSYTPDGREERRSQVGAAIVPAMGPDDEVTITQSMKVAPTLFPQFYELEAEIDPDDNIAEINEINNTWIAGQVAISGVEIEPPALDFGVVGLDCSMRSSFAVLNRGASPAFVSEVRVTPSSAGADPFRLGIVEAARLQPDNGLRVDVYFAPTRAGLYSSTIEVTHDQFLSPVPVRVEGYGEKDPARIDFFEQWIRPRVDILVVVDDSMSMLARRDRLVRQASSFFENLVDAGVDFQIGVTTTLVRVEEGGRLVDPGRVGGVLSPSTVDGAHLFATTLERPVRSDLPEQGLEAALRAISEPNRSTVNQGLLRPDASLAIIFISDTDDASPLSVDEYAESYFAERHPGGPQRVVVNAVVPPEGGCPGSPTGGNRYLDLVQTTGGIAESICDFAWTTAFDTFPEPGFGYRRRFPLDRRPLHPEQLVVYLNGQPLDPILFGHPTYHYISETNEVIFAPNAVPEPGALIEFRYRSEC